MAQDEPPPDNADAGVNESDESGSPANLSAISMMCRFCHSGENSLPVSGSLYDEGEPLMVACRCKGSMFYHRSCLEYWLNISDTTRCDICRHRFQMEFKFPSTWQYLRYTERVRLDLLRCIICALFCLPASGFMLYMCFFWPGHPGAEGDEFGEHTGFDFDRNSDFAEENYSESSYFWRNDPAGFYVNLFAAIFLLLVFITFLTAFIVYHVQQVPIFRIKNARRVLVLPQEIINTSSVSTDSIPLPDSNSTASTQLLTPPRPGRFARLVARLLRDREEPSPDMHDGVFRLSYPAYYVDQIEHPRSYPMEDIRLMRMAPLPTDSPTTGCGRETRSALRPVPQFPGGARPQRLRTAPPAVENRRFMIERVTTPLRVTFADERSAE